MLAFAKRVERAAAGTRRLIAIGASAVTLAEVGAADARAASARLSLDARHCFDCGAPFPEWKREGGAAGYATLRDPGPRGARVCYSCSDRRQRADFAKAERFTCYLTRNPAGGYNLTTWTGGHLATVTDYHERRVGFGWRTRRGYFRAVDIDGRKWHGTTPGVEMYARARLSKGNA